MTIVGSITTDERSVMLWKTRHDTCNAGEWHRIGIGEDEDGLGLCLQHIGRQCGLLVGDDYAGSTKDVQLEFIESVGCSLEICGLGRHLIIENSLTITEVLLALLLWRVREQSLDGVRHAHC